MDVTEADIAKIPRGNLRVARAEFVAMWVAAERVGGLDWYAAGVAVTCRWLACATVRPATGPWHPARAPVTGRSNLAFGGADSGRVHRGGEAGFAPAASGVVVGAAGVE